MTDPKENEEINEELSTDELKRVSGGFGENDPGVAVEQTTFTNNRNSNTLPEGSGYAAGASNPYLSQGSGSGLTKADFERANKRHGVVADENGKPCTGLVT
ncbi:possible DNA polymerase III beta subunit, cent [Prochlorococcus marinus str. MIT 9313]|uniref:Possible DNA polymerase III beta subunit, cent n=1 Tax=Prochlorococcus marinus (strain MIT 9313) TaxID=74547 RepID=Q7V8T9_PROMM|nr:CCRG-2 family protein [Prochlorococcus marinus]CAE20413.1 possible DNA polymerase III beta subunit, cent [Prochlorococcus marinus str. MIT 9313]